ncbi:MAG: DNA primase [Proteobacteria bacterium]|nr:MAG: DNA primase [Pseudomonadota bacterium]
MTSNFQQHGRALLGAGYLIIPIKPGHKRPALDNWQTARLGAADLTRYPNHGVGVLCGQGAQPIAAIDVDTTDDALAARFVAWCQEHLGLTCERVGNAPKILLAYRAEAEGWGKATGAWFEDSGGGRHRLEVLGKGQQFVAYHIHPDTGEPYEWVDFFGGLEAMRAGDLSAITEAQVEEALQVFEAMAAEAGLVRVSGSRAKVGGMTSAPIDDPLMAFEPPVGIDLDEARRLVAYVDNEDYDTWLKVGMSLHHEFDGDSAALDLWDEWSSTAANYGGSEDIAHRWDSFGRSGRNPTTARWLLKVGNQGKRDAVKAEKRTALDDAKGMILACRDSIDLVNDVARAAGEAAGTDLALRAELAGLIRARFKELTDTSLPVADVRAAMAGGRKVVSFNKQRRQMTEFGNAERMLDHYGDGLMYVPEIDGWFNWTGIYWRRAAGVELEHLAKETIRALPDEAKAIESDAERAEFFKFCAVSQRAVMVRNMVSLAQSDPRIVVGMSDLDKLTHLLGVGNGVVDLTTGKLLPPDQAYRVTTITATEYDPAAACPLFEQTVADVFFGDTDTIGFFQRLVGYSLLGRPDEDVLAIPYGSGSNGKSTVLGAIRDALGDHAKMASADTFLSSGVAGGNAGAAREDVLRLRGARFVYVSEPDEGSELREGLIKSMTGGEPLPARGLYSKTTVEVAPTWVAFMPTNHRPIVKGDDHAIWRRLLPVPFTRNFDQDLTVEKDPDRAKKLADEASGILAWCVRGALAYQQQGLRPPGTVRKARDEYKSDMDLLAEWLDECCEVGPGHVESNARLWASWEAFARARGELRFIASAKSLGRRLQSKGMEPVRQCAGLRGRGMVGIRVRQMGDFE